MKKVVILALCLLLVFMMAMPCFATDGEEVGEYAVGHAGGQVDAASEEYAVGHAGGQVDAASEEYAVGHAEGHVDATYGQNISTGTVIGIVCALVVVAGVIVLYLKKKRC